MTEPVRAESLAAAGTAHGFFTRRGGVSEGIFASLNCGPGSGDAPTKVAENRSIVARSLGCAPASLLTVWQVHGQDAVVATQPWSSTAPDRPKADALVTATPGVALGVLTADCAPVLLADPVARVIGAAHAGWKGALDGVLESVVGAMQRLGARRADIRAALGPCIGPDAYEVGHEFADRFLAASPDNARYFLPRGEGRNPHFDLPGYVVDRLRAMSLASVENVGLCTYESESDFFSYRRATHRKETDYGRQISAIVLV